MWNAANAGERRRSCAACKHQRKSCKETCVMAPHFPVHMTNEFALAHKVFGLSNMAKMLEKLDMAQQKVAVESFLWEARSWEEDPIHGPYGQFKRLQDKLRELQETLHNNHRYSMPPLQLPWIGDINNGGGITGPIRSNIPQIQEFQGQFGDGGYGIPVSMQQNSSNIAGGYGIPVSSSYPMSSTGINNPGTSSVSTNNYPRIGSREGGRYNPMGRGKVERFDGYNNSINHVNPDFGYGPVRRNSVQQARATTNGNGNRDVNLHDRERVRAMNCGAIQAYSSDSEGGDRGTSETCVDHHRQQNQMNNANQPNNVEGD